MYSISITVYNSNTYLKLNSKFKIKIYNSKFIFVPINSATLPLKSTYTSHGTFSSFNLILFYSFHLKSQVNPMFWLIKHYL